MVHLYETVVSLIAKDEGDTLQKKAYKIANPMSETETGRVALKSDLEEFVPLPQPQQRVLVCPWFDILHHSWTPRTCFVPSKLPEVMAIKEANEREDTRCCIRSLGCRVSQMKSGGIISSERVGDIEGAHSETQDTISEYFTMVTTSLARTTPQHGLCCYHVVVKARVRVPQGS